MFADLNPSLSTDEEIAALRNLLQRYLSRVGALSDASVPPGLNAANGWFRTAMVDDVELRAMTTPTNQFVSPDARALYDAFIYLGQGLRSAFSPENHPDNIVTDGRLFTAALREFGLQIVAVIAAIFDSSSGTDDEKEKGKQSLAEAIQALINKVIGSGVQYHGAHANGWIGIGVQSVGGALNQRLDQLNLTGDSANELRKVFHELSSQIAAIALRKFHPWLDAQWQLDFQSRVQASAAALALTTATMAPTREPEMA